MMLTSEAGLKGLRILVAEDEYLLADDVCDALMQAGAHVVGPVPSVDGAARLIEGEAIDAALLDINLRGEMVFAIADMLSAQGVPFAFLTGYDPATLPERYASVRAIQKPARAEDIVGLITPSLTAQAG